MTMKLSLIVLLLSIPGAGQPQRDASGTVSGAQSSEIRISIPQSLTLVDQNGQNVRFQDLVTGKFVVINTIFTTCTTICPVMGAQFAHLRKLLDQKSRNDVRLISISVDPETDTPARLKEWKDKYYAGSGWTLLTGEKKDIDYLLKSLKVFPAGSKQGHSPVVLIGPNASGNWGRADGINTTPEALLKMVPPPRASSADTSAARSYFTDVTLFDQDGRKLRFFSDLIQGKLVVINSFFTSCTNSCPIMAANLARIQDSLGDRLGKDASIVSLTVDPEVDTPAKLKQFASHMKARPGWEFVTGSAEDLRLALTKLGLAVEDRSNHLNLFIIGNEPTGLWKKANGMAPADQLIPLVASVLSDGR